MPALDLVISVNSPRFPTPRQTVNALNLEDALHNLAEGYEIMGMPAPETITTIEELLELPEDGMRHELLDGEHVVTPAPRFQHQHILSELWAVLREACSHYVEFVVLSSPADIYLGPQTLVQPDLFIVQVDPARRKEIVWKEVPPPLLAVEILSPATAARDRGKKRRIYLGAGIEEYWIVDIDARIIERWRSGDERPEIVDGELTWKLGPGIGGTVNVSELFG